MNARPEHAFREYKTVAQGLHNDTRGAVSGERTGREHIGLDCGRQLDSVTIECSGCGSQQFETEVTRVRTRGQSASYEIFELTLARFNPCIPR